MKEFAKKIIKWLATTKLLTFPRKIVGRAIFLYAFLISKPCVVISYNDSERSKVIALIKKIKNEQELLLENNERYQIFMAVKRTTKVNGEIAEVGIYKGGSAKLICEAKGDKALHLFDTFEGLPKLSEMDNPRDVQKGQYLATFEDVKTYLKKYPNIYFYKGLFPSTAEPIKNKKFSFVHLDADFYESTLSSLEFFYSKMSKGGLLYLMITLMYQELEKRSMIFLKTNQNQLLNFLVPNV